MEGLKDAMLEREGEVAGLEGKLRASEERVKEMEDSGVIGGNASDCEEVLLLREELSSVLSKLASAEVSIKAERDAAEELKAFAASDAAVAVVQRGGAVRGLSSFLAALVVVLSVLLMLLPSSGPYALRTPLLL